MRLVVDTNVLISALLIEASLPAKLVGHWRAGRFVLLTSAEQLEEMARVTRYPKLRVRLQPAVAGRLVNDLRKVAVVVEAVPTIEITRDPFDDFLLATALAGRADFLLTGDRRDLLKIGKYRHTRILAVRDFLGLHGWDR